MSDPREYFNDQSEALRIVTDRALSQVWTALPVRILEDSDGHACKAQSLIKVWQRNDQDGSMTPVEMSHFGEVPITYSQGGGFVITHPVKAGDEGIAVFSSRCIDGWWSKGGVQAEPFRRRHHLSDAMYIPGVRSNPRKIGSGNPGGKPPSTTSVQIRTEDGEYYIELTSKDVNIVCENCTVTAGKNVTINAQENVVINAQQNVEINAQETVSIQAPNNIVLNSPIVEVTGDIVVGGVYGAGNCSVNGTLRANGDIVAHSGVGIGAPSIPGISPMAANGSGSVSLANHVHQGVWAGGDTSGPPLPGS